MAYNPKDYRTNRKAVLELREKIFAETVTTLEAIAMGAKRAQLTKWEKEGKLKSISLEGKNRYDINTIKSLLLEALR